MSIDTISAHIKHTQDVLSIDLNIPHYQRPYRWSERNVLQLLNDINTCRQNSGSAYRIGSLILHKNGTQYDIVDGQQRITTLLLLLKSLQYSNPLPALKYNHADSFGNIKVNNKFISQWFDENDNVSKKEYLHYLLNKCEFVVIEVVDLQEAFQMFDSQNGRGKELEAYNLLKAYHIRAMEHNTPDERIQCDKAWEYSARFVYDQNGDNPDTMDLLRQLVNEQLYRTRIWSKKDAAFAFSKKEIDEFKGITIGKNHQIKHPFQNQILAQYIASHFSNDILCVSIKYRFNSGDPINIKPFTSINQPIVNGKAFFEYIETFVEIYKRIFVNDDTSVLTDFKSFYKYYCKYPSSTRTGDRYLREVYKSLIFIIFDKFGEDGVNLYYRHLYSIVYRWRLEKMQIKYASMAETPKDIFSGIHQSNSLIEMLFLEKLSKKELKLIRFKNAPEVEQFFSRTAR